MFGKILFVIVLLIVCMFVKAVDSQDKKPSEQLIKNCNQAFEALKAISSQEKVEESIIGPIPDNWQIVEKTREKSGVSSNPTSYIFDVFKIISRKNELKEDKYYKATWDKNEEESILSTWFTKGGRSFHDYGWLRNGEFRNLLVYYAIPPIRKNSWGVIIRTDEIQELPQIENQKDSLHNVGNHPDILTNLGEKDVQTILEYAEKKFKESKLLEEDEDNSIPFCVCALSEIDVAVLIYKEQPFNLLRFPNKTDSVTRYIQSYTTVVLYPKGIRIISVLRVPPIPADFYDSKAYYIGVPPENTKEPLEAKKSEELERLLKKGESIENQIEEFSEEVLLSGLAAALHSDDADVRFNAMGYLLSDEAVSDNRILPFLIELSQKMIPVNGDQKPLIIDTHDGNKFYLLTKLFIKYPDPKAIPFLCAVAKKGPSRFGSSNISSTDGEPTDMREVIGYFKEITEAIEQCTNGEIIKPEENIKWWEYKKIQPLVAK